MASNSLERIIDDVNKGSGIVDNSINGTIGDIDILTNIVNDDVQGVVVAVGGGGGGGGGRRRRGPRPDSSTIATYSNYSSTTNVPNHTPNTNMTVSMTMPMMMSTIPNTNTTIHNNTSNIKAPKLPTTTSATTTTPKLRKTRGPSLKQNTGILSKVAHHRQWTLNTSLLTTLTPTPTTTTDTAKEEVVEGNKENENEKEQVLKCRLEDGTLVTSVLSKVSRVSDWLKMRKH